jgi:hypothetical protein
MSKILSLLESKCITCKHFTAGKCKLFPLITNVNDDIVHGYDYMNCITERPLCNGKYYKKIELIICQEKRSKNECDPHYVIGVRRCS